MHQRISFIKLQRKEGRDGNAIVTIFTNFVASALFLLHAMFPFKVLYEYKACGLIKAKKKQMF